MTEKESEGYDESYKKGKNKQKENVKNTNFRWLELNSNCFVVKDDFWFMNKRKIMKSDFVK